MFNALILNQEEKRTLASIENIDQSQLPEGEVLIDVEYSSLNYKDGLAITGKGKVVQQFPMVPGIDMAGKVAHSDNPNYQQGDNVILTGWGVGEKHWGGMAQQARVKGDWLVHQPEGLTSKKSHDDRYGWIHRYAVCASSYRGGCYPIKRRNTGDWRKWWCRLRRRNAFSPTRLFCGGSDRAFRTKWPTARKTGGWQNYRSLRV